MKKTTQSLKENLLKFYNKHFRKKDLVTQLFLLIGAFFLIFIVRLALQQQEYITVKLITSGGEWWWYSPGPPQWLVDPVQIGTKEYNAAGKVIAEVLDIQTYTFNQQGNQQTSEKASIITARLAVTKQRGSNQYRFRRDPLQVGMAMYIAPNNIRLNCNVLWIEGSEDAEYTDKTIVVKDYDIYSWKAEAYKIGTKVTDGESQALAEIVDVTVSPSLVNTYDQWGNLYMKPSPLKVDATIRVKLKALTSDGDFYFLFQPLRIGRSIQIPFSTVAATDVKIISVE